MEDEDYRVAISARAVALANILNQRTTIVRDERIDVQVAAINKLLAEWRKASEL